MHGIFFLFDVLSLSFNLELLKHLEISDDISRSCGSSSRSPFRLTVNGHCFVPPLRRLFHPLRCVNHRRDPCATEAPAEGRDRSSKRARLECGPRLGPLIRGHSNPYQNGFGSGFAFQKRGRSICFIVKHSCVSFDLSIPSHVLMAKLFGDLARNLQSDVVTPCSSLTVCRRRPFGELFEDPRQ